MIQNANIGYNYQKNPNLNPTNKSQSQAALIIALRGAANQNRNVSVTYPVNQASPNLGAGSPTLLAMQAPVIGLSMYAGTQISGLGEIT